MGTRVTVVIPAYNATKTIGDGLEAFARQSFQAAEVEIIIVDDGSTDGTPEYIERYVKNWGPEQPRLRVMRQAHQGPAAARNLGAEAAQGEFLLFTDADCVPHLDWIKEMVAPFQSPSIAAVKGAYKTKQRSLVARFAQAEFEARYRQLAAAEYVDVVFSYSAGFRREIFRTIGGFDTSFPVADNEDTDLSYRVATAGYKIKFNPAAIIYHQHPATLKQYLRKKHSRAYWRVMVYKRFPGKAIRDSYTPQTLKLQIGSVVLGAGALAFIPLVPNAFYVAALAGGLFTATALPFLWQLPREDPGLRVAAPFLLVCRAVVMASGLVQTVPMLMSKTN
ncbi:MAG: glycosyltransferase [Nitrospira defluvii]|nr:glycosyltransferase [Nitrospira defluvii]